MNDYGQIIGSGQLPDGTFVPFLDSRGNIGPFSYSAGLPGPDLPFTVNHINSSWQMSGTVYLDLNGPLHALLYSLGNPLDLGTLGGTNSEALNLNDAGAVVGWSQTAGPNPSPRAFLFANGVMTDLGVLGHNPFSGPTFSIAYDVNNANQVVGASTTADGHVSPFLYDHGAMRDLGILDGGADGLALALNDAGQVVGYFTTDSTASQTHAFLFSDGVMRDLNDLVPAGSGWTLTSALGINNAGQIIGQGRYDGQSRAFLLTPVAVPLPRAAYPALATLAVAAVLPVARHRRHAQKGTATPLPRTPPPHSR
jgi:probable HAF family extracellular repeat protein